MLNVTRVGRTANGAKGPAFSAAAMSSMPEFVDETGRFKVDKQAPPETSPKRTTSTSPKNKEMQMALIRQETWQMHPQMSLRPDEDAIIHTHLVARLLPRVSGPSSPDILSSMVNYQPFLPTQPTSSTPVHKEAVRALAAVYFGKVQHDARIFDTGVQAYVRSLRLLRAALESPVAVLEAETLVSVLCLGLYENIAFSETTGWLTHYEGISNLIISALVRRRHCYLAQPEWQVISQSSSSSVSAVSVSARNPDREEVLTDMFAEVPGVLHDFELVQAADSPPECTAILHRCVQCMLSELHRWRRQLKEPVAYADMSLLALHSAVLLCLAPVCEALGLSLLPSPSHPIDSRMEHGMPAQVPTHPAARMALASNICRLAKVSFDRGPSSTGAFLFIFPLHVASRHISPGTTEAAWAENAMK